MGRAMVSNGAGGSDRVALIVSVGSLAVAGVAAFFTGIQTRYIRQTAQDAHQQAQDAHQQASDAHLEAIDAHKQLQLQFATSVSFEINTDIEHHRLGIGISNDGPGVAIIRSVTYYVDEKPTDQIQDELAKRGMDTNLDSGTTFEEGDTVGPGHTKWAIRYKWKNPSDEDRMEELIDRHVQLAIEYCDLNESCKRKCSEKNGCPKP
jgi:hypothetical protein